jgi:hypothetical protein
MLEHWAANVMRHSYGKTLRLRYAHENFTDMVVVQ